MIVSGLTEGGDWTFGRSLANYKNASQAIAQNIVTRVQSFKRDWYLDSEANIDWITLLGTRGTRVNTIRQRVERVVQNTEGVARVNAVSVDLNRATRQATITISVIDIYNEELNAEVTV